MTDQLEHDLTTLFGTTATEADVPALPLQDVLAQGRVLQQVRRRRAALWSAAAAAVAVVVVSLPLALASHHSGDERPAPAQRTTTTPASRTALAATEPYVRGGILHAEGRTFRVGRSINLVSAGNTVLVGHWGKQITWRTLRDGQLVPLPYGEGEVPVLNPDGTLVAVSTNPTPQTTRITLYDASTDGEIAHVDLALPATCCDGGSVQELRIDSTGTVHWLEERDSSAMPEMRWRPGSRPVQVGDAANRVSDPISALPQSSSPAAIATFSGGRLTRDGVTLATGVDTVSEAGSTILITQTANGGGRTVSLVDKTGTVTSLPELAGRPLRKTAVEPVLSPDGRYVAAVRLGLRDVTLVEWSVTRHTVTGSTTLPMGDGETVTLNGVDDDGRVYATTYAPRSGFTWKPGGAVESVTPGPETDLAAAGLGVVGPHGVLEPAGCDGGYRGVAPSGSLVLCGIGVAPNVGVVSVSTNRVVPLALPGSLADSIDGIGFESEHAVLVTATSSGTTWLLRCHTGDGSCERVAPVPDGTSFARVPGMN
jgi:hypothetical protein